MKNKYILFTAILTLTLLPGITLAALSYTPMEPIPGAPSNSGNFYDYISAVYKFGIWAVGISALLMITIGGYMYIMSAANVASAEKAKTVIADAIIGLILALTSYLLLYEINPNLVKMSIGPVIPPATTTPSGTTPSGTTPPGTTPPAGAEAAVRQRLSAAGIGVNHTACPIGQGTGCTSTGGLKESTINGLISFKSACNCNMTLTGGSETGHASTTSFNHANGYKADLGLNSTLTSYIQTTFTPTGTRSDGAATYKDATGNVYALEDNHWDICYSCH